MGVHAGDGQLPSLGGLLKDLAEGSTQLVRQEVRLARLELAELVSSLAKGSVSVVVGGILILLGGLVLLIGLILLGGDQWLRDRYWLAALILFVVSGGLALTFARLGASMLEPRQLVPDNTVETLKEDSVWLKRQLTSGVTSS